MSQNAEQHHILNLYWMKIIGEETKQGSPHPLLTAKETDVSAGMQACFGNTSVMGLKTEIFTL